MTVPLDWISAIWNKINKPLHFLFVGIALVLFAPEGIKWAGYIFVAMGLAGTAEWISSQVNKWLEEYKLTKRLQQSISALNADEKSILYPQMQNGEQTFYLLGWNDYYDHLFSSGAEDRRRRLYDACYGLRDKGILSITKEDTTAVLHITDPFWRILRVTFPPHEGEGIAASLVETAGCNVRHT